MACTLCMPAGMNLVPQGLWHSGYATALYLLRKDKRTCRLVAKPFTKAWQVGKLPYHWQGSSLKSVEGACMRKGCPLRDANYSALCTRNCCFNSS